MVIVFIVVLVFNSKGIFTQSDGSTARHVIIFVQIVVKVTSSIKYTKYKVYSSGNKSAANLMILGKSLIQKINNQTVYARYSLMTNFTQTSAKYCLSIHYNGLIYRLFANDKKQVVFRAKNSEIVLYKMCFRFYFSKCFKDRNEWLCI